MMAVYSTGDVHIDQAISGGKPAKKATKAVKKATKKTTKKK